MGSAARAHLETWRPYTLAHPGLVGLAGAAAGAGAHTPQGLLAAWLCPTLGWLGGHYLGDYFDRALDAIGKPQRPIPSGRLAARTALLCGLAAEICAAAVTLAVNWPVVVGVVLALAGIVAYSRVLKGRGILGNGVRGLLTGLAVLFGAAVSAPAGRPPSWDVLPVVVALVLHDTASNLVGTLRDTDADRSGGYRTVPVLRGVAAAARIAALLYLAALLCAVVHLATAARHPAAGGLLAAVAAVAGAAAFRPLLRTPSLDARLALWSHEVLVGERLVLSAAVIACHWGGRPALALLLPALAVSLPAQRRMRTRHEFPPGTRPRSPVPAPRSAPRSPEPKG
ncbi:UbiA family prenyltransferase [Streptomyces albus]|uniref:UbiA family prenyltransferase n=1 Tax=Streptomyces albus TaxID=1888 RepID=UPI0031F6B70A